MGIGPKEAIPKALKQAGLSKDQHRLDRAQRRPSPRRRWRSSATSASTRRRVNPLGGAIALGHPLGAPARSAWPRSCTACSARRQKYGMVTMCIGTGMGAAGIFEAV
jgi:acetyl-CoA acyltransferase